MGRIGRKQKKCLIGLLIAFSAFFIGFIGDVAHAQEISNVASEKEEAKKEDNKEKDAGKENANDDHGEGVGNASNGCEAYTSEKDRNQCLKDRKASTKTADFYSKAIMSLDGKTQELEMKEDYIKNFSNSSATAVSYDLWLADPPTIIMHIVNTITTIIEKLGSFISLAVLILYNVASSSFWSAIMRNIFDVIDSVIFDWDNPNSWFMKIVVLFGCIGVARKLMKAKKNAFTFRTFLSTIFEVVLSCALVIFVARYGRPLITYSEELISDSIVQTFSFGDNSDGTTFEMQNKRMIFDSLQKQGFILRHFGVTDVKDISNRNSGAWEEGDAGKKIPVSAAERVNTLLNEPSKDNAQIERQDYGNEDISYNANQCMNVMGLSIVFFIHRFLLGVVFGSGSLFLFAIGFIKELLLAVTTYAFVLILLRDNKGAATKWFSSRIQWTVLFILSNIVFSLMLFFTQQLVARVTGYGLLMILPFDAILVLLFIYVYKNKEQIWQKITADIDLDGEGAFNIAKGIITGDITPKDIYDHRSERKHQEALEDGGEDTDEYPNGKKKSSLNDIKDDKELAESEDIDEEILEGDDPDNNSTSTEEEEVEEDGNPDEAIKEMEESADSKLKCTEEDLAEQDEAHVKGNDYVSSDMDDLGLGEKDQDKLTYGESDSDLTNKESKSQSSKQDQTFKSDIDQFMNDLIKDDEEKMITPEIDDGEDNEEDC
ncbi:hypothetical protein M2475_001613 [Breznakia sp. PF5-3]|uniref:hypothetical protein n=1 Tax=unclassified Breznakia TaxID=2623764 RepID=UPI0024066F12|nr:MULTISPECIES: hypothetical protein [unclassified Breznakia]MDF9825179.1 hypothetical protein [Breznakia sp. PM6-1]MDF9836037.1 hypothetical protein [Breznakia sp. PF5-3]MDF9838602.1 hypothetical protein [Breznakia sp. PFB2-8]MDF9860629.1 hypothetical protein [Breznakia sp. PH5-24]